MMEHYLNSVPDVYIVDIDNTAEPYWLHMVAHLFMYRFDCTFRSMFKYKENEKQFSPFVSSKKEFLQLK